jgi:NAD(P)-dependent dehydrogenase (short-subunit alcohol dehydrogenase family)
MEAGHWTHRGANRRHGGGDRRPRARRRRLREDDVARWSDQAGPVELLVSTAGVQGPAVTFDQEEPRPSWQAFEIDIRGVFRCCHVVRSADAPGRIVNVINDTASLPSGGIPKRRIGRAGRGGSLLEKLAGQLARAPYSSSRSVRARAEVVRLARQIGSS